MLVATPRHSTVLKQTLSELPDLRGSVTHDLHAAALMCENGISRICTSDNNDFRRVPLLTVLDPLGES
jgi:predicted nucleic acid-binding protein